MNVRLVMNFVEKNFCLLILTVFTRYFLRRIRAEKKNRAVSSATLLYLYKKSACKIARTCIKWFVKY